MIIGRFLTDTEAMAHDGSEGDQLYLGSRGHKGETDELNTVRTSTYVDKLIERFPGHSLGF